MRRLLVALLALPALTCGWEVQRVAGSSAWSADSPLIEFKVDLRVEEPTFFAGGPVPFAIRVKLKPLTPEVEIPADWYTKAKLAWSSSDREQWAEVGFRYTAATQEAASADVVLLTPRTRGNSAYLVIPPEATEKLPIGTYRLKASVEIPVQPEQGPPVNVQVSHETSFELVTAQTSEQKSRLSFMNSRYQVETEKNVDAAIETIKRGLAESGDGLLNHQLGWLYQSRGDLEEAIQAYQVFIRTVRASNIPRDHEKRGPHEIADELETVVIPLLQERLARD